MSDFDHQSADKASQEKRRSSFDYQSADKAFQEKRIIDQLNRRNAFNRTMIPIILERIKTMLDPTYIITKDNPIPPYLCEITTEEGKFIGWEIGHGQVDGWGGSRMLLTTAGNLASFRSYFFRGTSFIGYNLHDGYVVGSNFRKTKFLGYDLRDDFVAGSKTDWYARESSRIAYENVYSFAAKDLKIPIEEIEAIRKAVGPNTDEEDELALAAENNITE